MRLFDTATYDHLANGIVICIIILYKLAVQHEYGCWNRVAVGTSAPKGSPTPKISVQILKSLNLHEIFEISESKFV